MSEEDLVRAIGRIINRVLTDKGELEHAIGSDTVILGGDLAFDSLDLAALVVELDETTGKSPFAGGFITFQMVGELAAIYCGAST